MDLDKLVESIKCVEDYVHFSQDILDKYVTSKIRLEMSTILSLKKMRRYEPEYFNKCNKCGAAFAIVEHLLLVPSCKTWNILGKELVACLQYWLDAFIRDILVHNNNWWRFINPILNFIQELRLKDSSLPNILMEGVAKYLLELAVIDNLDVAQRYEVIYCLNLICKQSSWEIRFALREQLVNFFIKLSTIMATCGHYMLQFSIMETLLLWLHRHRDPAARAAASLEYFPPHLYDSSVIEIFLKRPFSDSIQDIRAFLNMHNKITNLVTSVLCKSLDIGKFTIFSGAEKHDFWLDINTSRMSISMMLEPQLLRSVGVAQHDSYETLTVTEENTRKVLLYSESEQFKVSINPIDEIQLFPSKLKLNRIWDVTIVVSKKCDMKRIDTALRQVYGDKYQISLYLKNWLNLPQAEPEASKGNFKACEVEAKRGQCRRRRSGYMFRSAKNPSSLVSPSSTSTTSLAQLHEKLAALPSYTFDKGCLSVCALPQLSRVTELSEPDERYSNTNNTYRSKHLGFRNEKSTRRSKSDSENVVCTKTPNYTLSPHVVDEDSNISLLIATVGSTTDSIIKDSFEFLRQNNGNIVDLLMQEAIKNKTYDKDKIKSSGETKENTEITNNLGEIIENTLQDLEILPYNLKANKAESGNPVIISNSTSRDESTIEVEETPNFVNTRKRNNRRAKIVDTMSDNKQDIVIDNCVREEGPVFDAQIVDEYISKHFSENKAGDICISPLLAKKINQTSSESSDGFQLGHQYVIINEELNDQTEYSNVREGMDLEVIKCLNSVVDKVCSGFDKCTVSLNKNIFDLNTLPVDNNTEVFYIQKPSNNIETPTKTGIKPSNKEVKNIETPKSMCTTNLTLKYTPAQNKRELKTKKTICKNKYKSEISLPNRKKTEVINNNNINAKSSTKINLERKRRKLYSLKNDDQIELEIARIHGSKQISEVNINNEHQTPKSSAICYKELERERRKIRKQPVRRLNRMTTTLSPRTEKRNQIFDNLKNSIENNEQIVLVDTKKNTDLALYNFTSDSEDDDFKKKKIDLHKRISSTTVNSMESVKSIGHGRNKINSETAGNELNRKSRKKKLIERKNSKSNKRKIKEEANIILIDERIRDTTNQTLDTSFVTEGTKTFSNNEPEPAINVPVMELFQNINNNSMKTLVIEVDKTKNQRKKHKNDRRKVVTEETTDVIKNDDGNRTDGSLPALIIEPEPARRDDDSLTTNMVQKFKQMYQDPDGIVNETNTTYDLLTDVSKVNFSPHSSVEELRIEGYSIRSPKGPKTVRNIRKPSNKEKSQKKMYSEILKMNTEKSIEVINLLEIDDLESVKSIPTVGESPITAHGDLNEVPPSLQLLQDKIEPRNLELENFDQSLREHFNQLMKEIKPITMVNKDNDCRDSDGSTSPSTSLARSTFNNQAVEIRSTTKTNSKKFIAGSKTLPSANKSYSAKRNDRHKITPRSSASRNVSLSPLQIIEKIVSSPPPYVAVDKMSLDEIKNFQNKSNHSKSSGTSGSKRERTTLVKTKEVPESSPQNSEKNYQIKIGYKSIISPIRISNDQNASMPHSELSDKKVKVKSPEIRQYFLENNSGPSTLSSKISTSTKKNESIIMNKRKKSAAQRENKKRKFDVEDRNVEVASVSDASVNKINHWFRENMPSGDKAEPVSLIKDYLVNVMEKLDTTLNEMNQSTSKKLVQMFVEVHKYQNKMEENKQKMYNEITKEIITHMIDLMDTKFAASNKRSQEMNRNFKEHFERRTAEILREDSVQKRAMVTLLMEDMKTMFNNLERE